MRSAATVMRWSAQTKYGEKPANRRSPLMKMDAYMSSNENGARAMTALTPENARPGMRVKCVEDKGGRWGVEAGREYAVSRADRISICVEGNSFSHPLSHFVLAEPARPTLRALLAEHDPEFLAAVDVLYEASPITLADVVEFHTAYERANLHAPAEVQSPGVTDARATISDGWWA